MSKSNQVPDQHLRGYLNNRLPSREKLERIRAAGIVADDHWVEDFTEVLLDIRQAVRGGSRDQPARNWGQDA